MAKDRQIVDPGGVVSGKKVYKRGQEDELAQVISRDTARQLMERNVLQGDWSDAGEALAEAQAKAEAKATAPKK